MNAIRKNTLGRIVVGFVVLLGMGLASAGAGEETVRELVYDTTSNFNMYTDKSYNLNTEDDNLSVDPMDPELWKIDWERLRLRSPVAGSTT